MQLIEYPDREALTLDLAQIVAQELAQAIRATGAASLCLPGGSTPGPLISALSEVPLDWAAVTVFPGDERCVPEDHPRSNLRLIRRHLLEGRGAAATLLPVYDVGMAEDAAASDAAARVAQHLPISSLVVGMGSDMHVASLFPGSHGLEAALAPDAPAVVALAAPDGEARLTLTPAALGTATAAHLLIMGPDKRDALARAATLSPSEAPIRALWSDLIVHWAA